MSMKDSGIYHFGGRTMSGLVSTKSVGYVLREGWIALELDGVWVKRGRRDVYMYEVGGGGRVYE